MNPAVGRPGGRRLPGQLDDRDELLPHGLRPRAQPVRRRLPAPRPRPRPTPTPACATPTRPDQVIRYRDVTADELFEVARLVVAAEIAKIHTTEWTPQLLYDEPLYLGMNANWRGLFRGKDRSCRPRWRRSPSTTSARRPTRRRPRSGTRSSPPGPASSASATACTPTTRSSRPTIRRKTDLWSIENPDHVNGGINHFGSPFNFPEEFVTVYRLHTMVPDLIELPAAGTPTPNRIREQGRRWSRPSAAGRPRPCGSGAWPTGRCPWGGSAWACSRCRTIRSSCRTSSCRGWAAPTRKDRRGRARPHPRPRAGRAALQRVPPPVRAAAAHQLRRLHRHPAGQGLAGARRAGAAGRHHARGLRAAPLRRLRRSSPRRR